MLISTIRITTLIIVLRLQSLEIFKKSKIRWTKKGKIFVKIDVELKPKHPDLIKDIYATHYLVVSAEHFCNFIRNGLSGRFLRNGSRQP